MLNSRTVSFYLFVLVIALTLLLPGANPVAAETGSLGITVLDSQFNSISEAVVYLDGEKIGLTNDQGILLKRDLSTGSHKLVVKKSGYGTVEKEVTVEADRTKSVTVKLKEVGTGELVITVKDHKGDTIPEAKVYLNDELLGRTDSNGELISQEVPEGSPEVVVEKEDYKTRERSVKIKSEKTNKATLQLLPKGIEIIHVPEDYEKIQGAIDNAPKGSVVKIGPGIYTENIDIDKSLILQATKPGQVTISGNGPVVNVFVSSKRANVKIQGLTIGDGSKGIKASGNINLEVYGCTLIDNRVGIQIKDAAKVAVQNSKIRENANGISIEGSSDVAIIGNDISKNEVSGINVNSEEANVHGQNNMMKDNTGSDLRGFASPELREPLVQETQQSSVKVPEDFGNIQQAIDAVAKGGTIKISQGRFDGGLTIYKPLRLRGNGIKDTTIKGTLSVITGGNKVIIEELTVSDGIPANLIASSNSHLVLQDIKFLPTERSGVGVHLTGNSVVTAKNVTYSVGKARSVKEFVGFSLENNSSLDIKNSEITVEKSAIGVGDKSKVRVNYCKFNGSVWAGGNSSVIVRKSEISGTKTAYAGVTVTENAEVMLRNNVISYSKGYGVATLTKKCFPSKENFDKYFGGTVTGTGNSFFSNEKEDICGLDSDLE